MLNWVVHIVTTGL